MSTRAIREALEIVEEAWPGRAILGPMRAEAEAIERAAKDLDRYLMQPGWALPSEGATECENALVLLESIAKDAP